MPIVSEPGGVPDEFIVKLNCLVVSNGVGAVESCAFTVNVYVPEDDATPDIVPVEHKLKPAGKLVLPVTAVQVYGPVPPVAVKLAL